MANGLTVEPRTPIPAPSRITSAPTQRVVAGGDQHRDDEHVERQALLGHPERRPADGEDGHQDRDHPPLVAGESPHEERDAGLDGAGPHRDADEPADDEDEQGHVDGAEQRRRC